MSKQRNNDPVFFRTVHDDLYSAVGGSPPPMGQNISILHKPDVLTFARHLRPSRLAQSETPA